MEDISLARTGTREKQSPDATVAVNGSSELPETDLVDLAQKEYLARRDSQLKLSPFMPLR